MKPHGKKTLVKALFMVLALSTTFGCAVTGNRMPKNECNSSVFLSHWHKKKCAEHQVAQVAPSPPPAPAAPAVDPWAEERQRLLDRIAELEAREPEKEIVEVVKEVPGKALKRYAISTDILFDTGKDILKPEGKAAIDSAVADIKEKYATNRIVIEGHTDTDPIVVSNWKSNWELGAARALAVLHYLEDVHGFEGRLMSASTFSFHQPVADNNTAEGKSYNRRAEIAIYAEE